MVRIETNMTVGWYLFCLDLMRKLLHLLFGPFSLPLPSNYLSLCKQWTFELRKVIHLAFIPFIIAMFFHGTRLRNLGIILLAWYLVDRFYFTTRM